MRTISLLALFMSATLWFGSGCGDDPKNTPDPRLIPGGGIGDGAINGRINIYVIDGDTDEAVINATVSIGEPDVNPTEGATDSDGLFSLDSDSLKGPTTITVVADGYVPSTWFGANGANMTIPLTKAASSSASVPQATLTGTIAGWDDMPDPAANHVLIALISYSQTTELGDAANNITQPAGGAGLPPNVCTAIGSTRNCDWSLISRTGNVAVFAAIIDLDTKGTPAEDDDETTLVGYAYKKGLVVEDHVDQSGVTLDMIDAVDLTNVDLLLAPTPSAFDTANAIVGVDLGEDGIMQLAFVDTSEQTSVLAPELSGGLAGASYRGTALAGNADEDEDDRPITAIVRRGVTDVTNGLDFGPWLAQPTALERTDGLYSFTPVNDASYHVVGLRDADNDRVWEIALLDGRTAFTLPALDPDPIPSGAIDMTVTAFEGDVDLTDFAIDDLIDALDRIAIGRVSL